MASPVTLPHRAPELPFGLPLRRRAGESFPRARSRDVRALLRTLVARYPEALRSGQAADVERIGFQLDVVRGALPRPGVAIADLGGGIGLFSPACAALGMQSFLIDDFRDPVNRRYRMGDIGLHDDLGVQVRETDVRDWGRFFPEASLDVVTTFDSIEHWHHSPRPVLEQAWRALRPGGLLFIGSANAVNLSKRIGVPLGRSNWSHFDDWFEPEEFRGHVREPVLADLLRLVDALGFERRGVFGRNWAGYLGGRARRLLTRLIDRPLRLRPTLCSDLYVLAAKPH